MATFKLNSPTGEAFTITAPDNATEEQIAQAAQAAFSTPRAETEVGPPENLRLSSSQIQAQETGPVQAALVGVGKGLTTFGRGLGLIDPAEGIEEESFAALKEESPIAAGGGEIVGEAAIPVGAALATGGVGGLATQIPLQAGIGAVEGAILAKGGGKTSDEILEAAGTGGAIALGAEILFPVIGRLGGKIVRSVTGKAPKGALIDAAGKPTQELTDALRAEGRTFEELSQEATETIQAQATGAAPEQAARIATAGEEGIPLTTGQAQQDFATIRGEEELRGAVGGGGETVRQFDLVQSEAIDKALADLGGTAGLEKTTFLQESGGLIKDALTGRKKLLRKQKNELYKKASEIAENQGPRPGLKLVKDGEFGFREGGERFKSQEFTVLDNDGVEQAFLEVSERGDTLFIESIGAFRGKIGGKGVLGPTVIRNINDLLAAQFPNQKFIAGKRVSGAKVGGVRGVAGEMADVHSVPVTKRPLTKRTPKERALGGIPIFTDGIKDAIPDAKTLRRIKRLKGAQSDAVDDLLTEFGFVTDDTAVKAFVDSGGEVTPLSLENAEDFRQALNQIERADIDNTINVVTGPIKEALDKELDQMFDVFKDEPGFPSDLLETLGQARATTRQLKTEFSPQSLAGRLVDVKKDSVTAIKEASQVYDNLVAASTPIEDLGKTIGALRDAGEEGTKALEALKTTVILDLLEAGFSTKSRKVSGVQIFNPVAFRNRIAAINKKGDKLAMIFGGDKNALSKLKNIENVAKTITPPDRAQLKGSADFAAPLLRRLISVASNNPLGALVIETASKTGGEVVRGLKAKKAVAGKPEILQIENELLKTFPSVAAALGIVAQRKQEEAQ